MYIQKQKKISKHPLDTDIQHHSAYHTSIATKIQAYYIIFISEIFFLNKGKNKILRQFSDLTQWFQKRDTSVFKA